MNLSKKLLLNTIVQFGGKILSTGFALVTLGILSRYLGAQGLGEYATILRYVGFFGIIADLGLNLIVTREISVEGADEEKIMANALTLRIISAVFVLLIAPLSSLLFYDNVKIVGIWIILLTFISILISQLYNGVFQKHLRTDKIALAELVNRSLILAGVILVSIYNRGLYDVIWVMNIANFISLVMIFIFVQKYIKIKLAWDKTIILRLVKLSIPLAIINIFNLIYFNIDSIFLSIMKGDIDVGIYHVAYKVLETLFALIVLFVGLFIPILSKHYHAGKSDFNKNWQKLFDNIAVYTIPMVLIGIFFAADIVNILAGSEFNESILTLQILFPAIGVLFFTTLLKNSFVVMDKQNKVIWVFMIGSILNVIANILVIPHYSYLGAAATTLFSEALVFILCLFIMIKRFNLDIKFNIFIKTILVNIILGLFLYFTSEWILLWKSIGTIIIFIIILLAFKLPYKLAYEE